MKETTDSTFATVKKIFSDYMSEKGFRKTPERFTILREIYATDGHFGIETLYNKMKDNKYRVSRATLYNTIELLLDCNLVIKHQFGHNGAQYERSYKFKQHDHFVDIETGTVLEYCDPRLLDIQKSVEQQLGVKITQHSLTFYGHLDKKDKTKSDN
jgi:Fe2+/Zn2+ uptake regulation proteins